MDIKQIRLANINYLADLHGRDRLAECDERKKWTPNYINQLCGGFGSFGAVTARRVEKGLKLDFGWMDLPHAEVVYSNRDALPSDDAGRAEIVNLWESLKPEDQRKLLKIGKTLAEQ